jgi:hypothetical protein
MPDPMEGPARTRLVALVVLLAAAVPLTIVAVAGSGGGAGDEEPALRVERSPEVFEVRVFVLPEVNTLERSGGRRSVVVACVDGAGSVISNQTERWPFTDTDRGTLDPHAHVPVNPARIDEVERCRIRPAEPPLVGDVG